MPSPSLGNSVNFKIISKICKTLFARGDSKIVPLGPLGYLSCKLAIFQKASQQKRRKWLRCSALPTTAQSTAESTSTKKFRWPPTKFRWPPTELWWSTQKLWWSAAESICASCTTTTSTGSLLCPTLRLLPRAGSLDKLQDWLSKLSKLWSQGLTGAPVAKVDIQRPGPLNVSETMANLVRISTSELFWRLPGVIFLAKSAVPAVQTATGRFFRILSILLFGGWFLLGRILILHVFFVLQLAKLDFKVQIAAPGVTRLALASVI